MAVSAIGYLGTFPTQSSEGRHVAAPYGQDNNLFVARFSNCGEKIELTAPGVGVLSTFTAGRYGAKGGTSMACAAVTGSIARLLSLPENRSILEMKPSEERSAKIASLAFQAAKTLRLPPKYEGHGMIR